MLDLVTSRPQGSVVRSFRAGQTIFLRGEPSDSVLYIKAGLVKAVASTPSGREVVLAFRREGDYVGEQSVLDGGPRSATVEAVTDVEGVSVTKACFLDLLREHPDDALELLGTLSRRLRDADSKRIEFAEFNTIQRVALRLLEYGRLFGREEGGVLRVPVSQEELAGATSSSIESVGRALQTMRTLKCVETRRRDIAILDREALEALYNL